MRKLLLMRHAKSDWNSGAAGDHARPLNRRGQRDAPRMGAWMAENNHLPDTAVVSDAVRTRQTFDGVSDALGQPDVSFHPALYHADPYSMLDVLQGVDNAAQSVLLIAHQPGMSGLTRLLMRDTAMPENARAFQRFSTASVAIMHLEGANWQALQPESCTFAEYIRPKELD